MQPAVALRNCVYFATENICFFRTTLTVNSDYFPKQRLHFDFYNGYGLRSSWGRNCSFMYNLDTQQSSKVYLRMLLEVKCFLCLSAFLAFAQCIRLLETRNVQVMVLFQLKLRKWKWTPSTYEWTLYPCVRHFVRWTFSPFLHPPIHPPTDFSTEMIRSTQVTHPALLRLGGYGGMDMHMGQGALSWRCKTHLGNYL